MLLKKNKSLNIDSTDLILSYFQLVYHICRPFGERPVKSYPWQTAF